MSRQGRGSQCVFLRGKLCSLVFLIRRANIFERMTWPPPHLSFFLPLVKNWHFAFSFLFHFASPLFFFLFIAFLTNFAYMCTCILQVERKAFSFFSFFFSVQGVLRCYNIPVFKLDCAFSDDVPLVSTWSFSMSFFFFPLSFFYSLWYYRRIN